jgi:hypothetical protein
MSVEDQLRSVVILCFFWWGDILYQSDHPSEALYWTEESDALSLCKAGSLLVSAISSLNTTSGSPR